MYRMLGSSADADDSPEAHDVVDKPALRQLDWIKASRSYGHGDCVQLAADDDMIALRDSKNPAGAYFEFTRTEMVAFLDGVRRGEFNKPHQRHWVKASRSYGHGECVELAADGDMICLRDSKDPAVCLHFTRTEMAAFVNGARRGEFDHLLG